MITTLDVPAISAYLKVGIFSKSSIELANIRPQYYQIKDNHYSRWFLEQVIAGLNNVWMRKTVKDLLWGYDEKLFMAAQFSDDPPPFEK